MSIHPDIQELIHASIDGVASDAQEARLRDAMARDPEVRDEYRRLTGLCEILARVAHEEPSPELAGAVLRGIRARRAGSRTGFMDRVRDAWPGGRVAIRYAYAVAAGAVIGILGFHVATGASLFGPAVPERDASATLMPAARASRLDLAPAGVPGTATLTPSGTGAAIGLDLNGKEPVELVLRFDPSVGGGRVDVSVLRAGKAAPAGSLRLPKRD